MMPFTKHTSRLILAFSVLLAFSSCYDLTVRVVSLPANTPPAEPIYISGNFNNWDPGDPDYILRKNSDSVYEVRLPRGIGEVEYKFTRGDWSTVEKDPCGFEISNRVTFYGKYELIMDTVRSWNDLPKPGCPSFTIILESIPENTPENATLYLAGNFNDWDPGSRYWMFNRSNEGIYFIEVPRTYFGDIEFKVTRGSWHTVECRKDGMDNDNHIFRGNAGDEVKIVIQRWKDRQ